MAESSPHVVQTRGLTKVFRDFWLREKVTAVSDLNMTVRPREVFGLLGPNGSGKSTTLKMVLGLLFPTKGTISIFGKHPTNVRVRNRIGFLPEESHLYPFLNARETLDFYGRLFHLPREQRQRRIDMLLDMVGLTSVAFRRVGEYSKGMQRRIGLAQALINDPDLLILDEPTSGLDPIGTRQFKDLIRALADRGKTVILSSHLLGDVEDVCDRVTILYGGRERAEGAIDDLLARQDQTQLTVGGLDDDTLERIRGLLSERGLDAAVSAPRDRLEDLFLRIVEDARREKISTGGAMSGGKVAEFLVTGDGGPADQLIESLVSAAAEEGESEIVPEPAEPEVPAADQSVLEELTSAEPEPEPAAQEQAPAPDRPRQAPQADRSVIEGLLSLDDDQEDRAE